MKHTKTHSRGGNVQKKQGFTLTELMISVLILSLTVALLHTGLNAHVNTLRAAALLQDAQRLAHSELWSTYSLPFKTLANLNIVTSSTPECFRIGSGGTIQISALPDALDLNHLTLICQISAPALRGYGEHYRTPQTLVRYQLERYNHK